MPVVDDVPVVDPPAVAVDVVGRVVEVVVGVVVDVTGCPDVPPPAVPEPPVPPLPYPPPVPPEVPVPPVLPSPSAEDRAASSLVTWAMAVTSV